MIHAPVEAARSIRNAAEKTSNFLIIKGLFPWGRALLYTGSTDRRREGIVYENA